MWKRRFVLCAPEGDGSSGGGGEGQGGTSGGGEGAPAGAEGNGAAAGGDAASLLAQGAQQGVAAGDFIPEKFRVNKEDGSFDLEASSRKLAESYGNLEKHRGTDEVRPATAEEYQVQVPDALKDMFDPKNDAGTKEFLAKAHEAGFTQKQIDLAMSTWFDMAPKLLQGSAALDQTQATETLKKAWTNDGDFNRNVANAFRATAAAVERAGLSMDEVEKAGLGNNPTFLRLMSALGHEFQEDSTPGTFEMRATPQDDVETMMRSEAYTDPHHKDHARVSAAVRGFFERKHGTAPVG